MNPLKQRLLDEYGRFSDKRIKRPDKGTTFIIDNRDCDDVGAERHLLSYFCAMFAEVSRPEPLAPEGLTVSLNGNVPTSTGVQSWAKKHGAEFRDGVHQNLRFQVAKGKQSKLRSLARAIRAIGAPGAPRYSVPSYKYVCPRTATALERLADVLDEVWGSRA